MKKLFYNFFNKACSNKVGNKYKRINTSLPPNQLVFINSIERYRTNYLVKCNLYEHYSLTKNEIDKKISKNETLRINGKEYKIVRINDKEYELRGNSCTDTFSLYEENDDRYYAYFVGYGKTELCQIKDRNVEFIASKDAYYEVYGIKEKLNICNHSTPIREWVMRIELCHPVFKNGKCIGIINLCY